MSYYYVTACLGTLKITVDHMKSMSSWVCLHSNLFRLKEKVSPSFLSLFVLQKSQFRFPIFLILCIICKSNQLINLSPLIMSHHQHGSISRSCNNLNLCLLNNNRELISTWMHLHGFRIDWLYYLDRYYHLIRL